MSQSKESVSELRQRMIDRTPRSAPPDMLALGDPGGGKPRQRSGPDLKWCGG